MAGFAFEIVLKSHAICEGAQSDLFLRWQRKGNVKMKNQFKCPQPTRTHTFTQCWLSRKKNVSQAPIDACERWGRKQMATSPDLTSRNKNARAFTCPATVTWMKMSRGAKAKMHLQRQGEWGNGVQRHGQSLKPQGSPGPHNYNNWATGEIRTK